MQSRTALIAAAQNLLAQYETAVHGTVVTLWQRPGEPNTDYAARAKLARSRLPDDRLLLAVCSFGAIARSQGILPVELPPKMLELFDRPARYRVCFGGRGAGRSWSFARVLLVKSLERRIRVLCAREFQNSIADSILTLLADQMELLGLSSYFEVQNTTIIGRNGSEFIFAGIKSNINRIRSLEGINIAYCEEAAGISKNSWETLIPTLFRVAGGELWCAFNPDLETDPTHQRFVVHPPDNSIIVKSTFEDNPWLPSGLRAEMEYLKRVDYDAYMHVWEGNVRTHSDAQIFRGKFVIDSFEPASDWNGPFFGADWGFSQDPTALVKCWISGRTLYVEHEAYAIGCDIDRTPALFDLVPGARHATIRADSARPETISYMKRHGYPNMASVNKWSGSVEDGIAHLRQYERIVIHPRCVHVAEEMRLFSFKVDRLSGDILATPEDRHNHCVDALRYALQPMIKPGGPEAFLSWLATQIPPSTTPAPQLSLTNRPGTVTDLGNPGAAK
jgi:phage terminase large subunit